MSQGTYIRMYGGMNLLKDIQTDEQTFRWMYGHTDRCMDALTYQQTYSHTRILKKPDMSVQQDRICLHLIE